MSKKKLIPFSLMPGAWGLKGKTRERAQAEYELEGYDLEIKLAELDYTGKDLSKKRLEIDRQHGKVSAFDYEMLLAEFLPTELEQKLAQLEAKRKFNQIEEIPYEKEKATLKKEPWVHVMKVDVSTTNPSVGSMELDWNDFFVEMLEKNGYTAPTPDEVVSLWYTQLCKNIFMEEYQGVGDYEEMADEMETRVKRIDENRIEKR